MDLTASRSCSKCGGDLTIFSAHHGYVCDSCGEVKTVEQAKTKAKKNLENQLKTLQKKIKQREKENQLKLFEVKLSGHREFTCVVAILAKDELEAKLLVLENYNIVGDLSKIQIEVREITGPFKAGFILGRWSEK